MSSIKNWEVLVLVIDSGISRYFLGFICCYIDLQLPSLALLLLWLKAVYQVNAAFCYQSCAHLCLGMGLATGRGQTIPEKGLIL